MSTLLAAAPLILATLAILLARQSAMRAGGLGLAAAILIAAVSPDFHLAFADILSAVFDGLLTTATVAYVLLGGVTLYWVLKTGNALERLGRAAAEAIPDPAERVLVLVLDVYILKYAPSRDYLETRLNGLEGRLDELQTMVAALQSQAMASGAGPSKESSSKETSPDN